MKKRYIYTVIFLFILSFSIFLFYILNNNKIENSNSQKQISENSIDYKKIWIDPNKYSTFSGFLEDFKSFSWVTFDVSKQDFVIWKNNWKWGIIYTNFTPDTNYIFDDKKNKNEAIIDIYTAYKNNNLFWWKNSDAWSKIIFEKDLQYKQTETLNKIFSKQLNVYDVLNNLNNVEIISNSQKELSSYLSDFIWDYEKSNKISWDLCKENKDFCTNFIDVIFSWTLFDEKWNFLTWANVELLNNPKIRTTTDEKWNYFLKFSEYNFSHLRIKASKIWYSDAFLTHSLNNTDPSWIHNYEYNFTLNKANKNISIDLSNSKEYTKWWFYIFKTEQSTYFAPKDWFYYLDWTKFNKDNIDVYLYEFNKWSKLDDLITNDTFDPVYGYVWNLMKTFWMPYIQFFDKSWKEIFVKSSNPIILQNKIYHMKELYENYDRIYEAVTKDNMKELVQISKDLPWYPIDFDWQIENWYLRWPTWWALDRKTWIWWNVWHRVLNEDWLVELPFYSIKDN